jgi:hypothetical protein
MKYYKITENALQTVINILINNNLSRTTYLELNSIIGGLQNLELIEDKPNNPKKEKKVTTKKGKK